MNRNLLIILFVLLTSTPTVAKVIPSQLISDNMVLQQQTEIKLWGEAAPNSKVTASPSWSKKKYTYTSDANGNWLISIQTPEASYTPHSITFNDGDGRTIISNILIGEVWFASGQSNMEMPLKGFKNCPIKGAIATIAHADANPPIRMFNVERSLSHEPERKLRGNWMVASSETVPSFSAAAYSFALSLNESLHVPIGIISCSAGGSKVEGWMSKEPLQQYPNMELTQDKIERIPDYLRPMVFYNAMLHPACNYTIKGFIWYQGESNVGVPDYSTHFIDMIHLWRKMWQAGDLPFYYVEIAPFNYQGHQDERAPYLREEQYKIQNVLPNCGMISTNDLVEPYEANNVHPRNKEEIGKRLSYLALNNTYNKKSIPCRGPEYKAMEIKGNKILLTFHNVGIGFSRSQDIKGFEIAGADSVFHLVDHIELKSDGLLVSSQQVSQPVAVRYCFKDFQTGNMGGEGELPMVPFRTDNW